MKLYSYNEVEQIIRRSDTFTNDPTRGVPTIDDILNAMRNAMVVQGIGEDDSVWRWPHEDDQLKEAYDRAMNIL